MALLNTVYVAHSFLIPGGYLLQEFFLWIPPEQRVADENPLVTAVDRQRVRYSHFKLVLEAELMEMIFDCVVITSELLYQLSRGLPVVRFDCVEQRLQIHF